MLEDDSIIPEDAWRVFSTALACAEEDISGEWDLLYTDVFLTPDKLQFQELSAAWNRFHEEEKLTLISLANMNFTCTSSFFVHKNAVGRLADLLKGQWCQF